MLCRSLLLDVAVTAAGLVLLMEMAMAVVKREWCRVSVELWHTTKLRGGVSKPGNAWLGLGDRQCPLGTCRRYGDAGKSDGGC